MDRELNFSSNEVAELAGITPRQLQWWDEQKVICPRHLSHQRHYSETQVLTVILVARMRYKNVSLQRIRKLLPNLNMATIRRFPDTILILRNRRWLICYDKEKALETIDMQDGSVTVVCLRPLLMAFQKACDQLSAGKTVRTAPAFKRYVA